MGIDTESDQIETVFEERFRCHRHAGIIVCLPGVGVILGTEFLAATGRGQHRLR